MKDVVSFLIYVSFIFFSIALYIIGMNNIILPNFQYFIIAYMLLLILVLILMTYSIAKNIKNMKKTEIIKSIKDFSISFIILFGIALIGQYLFKGSIDILNALPAPIAFSLGKAFLYNCKA